MCINVCVSCDFYKNNMIDSVVFFFFIKYKNEYIRFIKQRYTSSYLNWYILLRLKYFLTIKQNIYLYVFFQACIQLIWINFTHFAPKTNLVTDNDGNVVYVDVLNLEFPYFGSK